MKPYVRLLSYFLAVFLLVGKPLVTNGQHLEELKKELEQKKIEKELAEANQARLEADKAALIAQKTIDDAGKPAEKTPQQLAEERKAISEADAAALKAKKEMLASPFTVAPSSGSVSATGAFPEANILNQESLSKILGAMIKNIQISTPGDPNDKKQITLVIYNATDFNGLTAYESLLDQFTQFHEVYGRAIKQAKDLLSPPKKDTVILTAAGALLLAPAVVSSIVQTVGGIIQLFRSDVSFTNTDLTIDEFNLVSLMMSAIRSEQVPWHVYYPAVYPIEIVKRSGNASELQQKITAINEQSAQAREKLTKVEEKLKELSTKAAPKPAGKGLKLSNDEITFQTNLTTAKASLQTAEKAYTDVLSSLNTVDPTAKLTPLVMMTRIERLSNTLKQKDTYVVKMAATATGSQKVTKNTVRRTRIEHSAGAVLSYEVFDPTGLIICGSSLYDYSPYQESQNIVRKSSIPTMILPPAQMGTGAPVAAKSEASPEKK